MMKVALSIIGEKKDHSINYVGAIGYLFKNKQTKARFYLMPYIKIYYIWIKPTFTSKTIKVLEDNIFFLYYFSSLFFFGWEMPYINLRNPKGKHTAVNLCICLGKEVRLG